MLTLLVAILAAVVPFFFFVCKAKTFMELLRKIFGIFNRNSLKISLFTLLLALFSFSLAAPSQAIALDQPMLISALAQGNAITDPKALLRYALPIENKPIRQLQADLEDISNHLRAKRWPLIARDAKSANSLLSVRSSKILESVPSQSQPQAEELLTGIKAHVTALNEAIAAKDQDQVFGLRDAALDQIGELEALMVKDFPYEVPAAYANLPQLKGRATIKIETTQGPLTVVVDGYSAPVTAGNFVDLVQRGFYNNLPFTNAEDGFAVQTGDPEGPEAGFIDPKTKAYRAIPLEVFIKGEEIPIYGMTLEEAGLYLPELALPFNAFGAVALAHPDTNPNGGSSQFFFFKFDSELTPPGFNLMDGRYSVFGYLVEGKETLEKLTDQDKVIAAKVIEGADNLVQPVS